MSRIRELRPQRQPGTRAAVLAAVMEATPCLYSVELHEHPGFVAAVIRLRWYAWLTFGWTHRRALERARLAIRREVAALIRTEIYLWP